MTHADKWLVALIVPLVILSYVWLWRGGEAGSFVEIKIAGQATQTFSLNENRHLVLQGLLGESEIEIHDHQVRFVRSPCQAKLCIRSGWLNHAGDFAACLPNGISVYVPGKAPFDAINF